MMMISDSTLSIKDASGRQFSLLNDNTTNNNSTCLADAATTTNTTSPTTSTTINTVTSPRITRPFKVDKLSPALNQPVSAKRKYHCAEPGCNKSFTTSGHLARHNRIHTGEKNFQCLHPGCPSRFSRQDNMMQHYRTHLSQKMRRQKEKMTMPPRLYSHSYHDDGGEHHMLQPLITRRPRRATTMPSMPYPYVAYKPSPLEPTTCNKPTGRPKRALSTSSTCSSVSSPEFNSPTTPLYEQHQQHYHHHHHQQQQQHYYQSIPMLPIPNHYSVKHPQYQNKTQHHQQKEQDQWSPASPKPLSSLLHLANIVSTFG